VGKVWVVMCVVLWNGFRGGEKGCGCEGVGGGITEEGRSSRTGLVGRLWRCASM